MLEPVSSGIVDFCRGGLVIPDTQGSLVLKCATANGSPVCPFYVAGNGRLSIGFGCVTKRPRLEREEDRQKYWQAFNATVGGISTDKLAGFPSFPVDQLNNPQVISKFDELFRQFTSDVISES